MMTEKEQYAIEEVCRNDLYTFNRYMFLKRRGFKWLHNWHHEVICNALERVYYGECKRLIINIPPRYSKTEIAVINFSAWALGKNPDAEFIHASYSATLAEKNGGQVRDLIDNEYYKSIFDTRLESLSKGYLTTKDGGAFYTVGTGGTLTGFGAGKPRKEFGGCFPYWQKINTDKGALLIGDIVENEIDCKVWSYDEETKKRTLSKINKFWKNPSNDLIRVNLSDGSHFDCTPDHKILTDSGWVRAIHLADAFNLSQCKSSQSTSFCSTNASIISDFNSALGVLWSCVPLSVRKMLSNRFPSLSSFNLSNNSYSYAILESEFFSIKSAFEYFNNLLSSEFSPWSFLEERESSMSYSILHIIGLSAIRKIAKMVVGGVSVKMSDFVFKGSFAYELLSNEMMNKLHGYDSMNGEINPEISFTIGGWLEKSQGGGSSDLSAARNLIKPIGVSDVFPVSIDYVGHIDNTFCLEIDRVNNFELYQSGVIVSNCIIIDDPHKADEATSEVRRENVIEWFQNTLESRTNSPDTPIVVIMQRLHEEDLAGWLLNGGNGEKWEHLCLPVLNEENEPLWKAKHDLDDIERMRKSNSYVFNGQYMQSPFAKGGDIIRTEWFKEYRVLPKMKRIALFADTAQKTKEHNDYSVIIVAGLGDDGNMYIIDLIRGKWEAPELEKKLKSVWDKYKPMKPRGVYVEDKASGTSLIQTIQRQRYFPVKAVQVDKDKYTRVMGVTGYLESGFVYIPESAEWKLDFTEECEKFTANDTHKHDDQIDAMVMAINELLMTSKGLNISTNILNGI